VKNRPRQRGDRRPIGLLWRRGSLGSFDDRGPDWDIRCGDGWDLRGQRLDPRVPHGHWKTLTFIAALRHDRIDAPWVINGPINGELFATYVEQVLAPTLAPGDIVILDNLSSHNALFPLQ
jgi:hypothetical protein